MIFRFVTIYKNIKEGRKDPTGFASNEALSILKGAIIPFTIVGFLLVVVFFLLGFSSFWFGPSGFFKVLAIIGIIVWLGWLAITQLVLYFARKMLKYAKREVDSHIFHKDVTPK